MQNGSSTSTDDEADASVNFGSQPGIAVSESSSFFSDTPVAEHFPFAPGYEDFPPLGQEEEVALPVAKRNRVDEPMCPLCWEQLEYAQNGKTKVVQNLSRKVTNLREVIFRFERTHRGRIPDNELFPTMLKMRSMFLETFYDKHDIAYTPWTLDLIRKHYYVHEHDRVRKCKSQLAELEQLMQLCLKNTSKMNDKTLTVELDKGSLDTYSKLSKRHEDLSDKLDKILDSFKVETSSIAREIQMYMQEVKEAEAKPKAISGGEVTDLFSLGVKFL